MALALKIGDFERPERRRRGGGRMSNSRFSILREREGERGRERVRKRDMSTYLATAACMRSPCRLYFCVLCVHAGLYVHICTSMYIQTKCREERVDGKHSDWVCQVHMRSTKRPDMYMPHAQYSVQISVPCMYICTSVWYRVVL